MELLVFSTTNWFFLLFFLIEWTYQYGLKSLIMFAYTYNNVCVVTPVWMLALIPFVVCQFDVFFFLWDIKAMFDISINLGYKVRPWNGGLVFDSYSAPIEQHVAIYNALCIFGVEVVFFFLSYFHPWVFRKRFSAIQTYSSVSFYEFSLSRALNASFIELFLSYYKVFLLTGHQVPVCMCYLSLTVIILQQKPVFATRLR